MYNEIVPVILQEKMTNTDERCVDVLRSLNEKVKWRKEHMKTHWFEDLNDKQKDEVFVGFQRILQEMCKCTIDGTNRTEILLKRIEDGTNVYMYGMYTAINHTFQHTDMNCARDALVKLLYLEDFIVNAIDDPESKQITICVARH
jgi:hypothetical protein